MQWLTIGINRFQFLSSFNTSSQRNIDVCRSEMVCNGFTENYGGRSNTFGLSLRIFKAPSN